MTITTATPSDWIDFWENEMSETVSFDQEQLTALLSLSEQIQETIQVAAELWDMSDFEENALCGIVADAFAEKGIKLEALV